MDRNLRRIAAHLLLIAPAAALAAGCGESVSATPLDPARAVEALKATLDAWKRGEPPEALKAANPPVVAQDMDWQGGAKLVDYALDGEGHKVDSNLRAPVRLTLKAADGKEVLKSVTYLVTTSPAITVFRAFP